MTVPNSYAPNIYTASGSQTAFAFTFQIISDTNGVPDITTVEVQLNSVVQNSGFTTVANSNQYDSPGGTVTFNTPPTNGTVVGLFRNTPVTQLLDFPLAAKFSTAALEVAFDKTCMDVQENEYALSLKPDLPPYVQGDVLQWDPTGDTMDLVNATPASIVASVPGMGNGNVIGPSTSIVGNLAAFANTNGQLIEDSGLPLADVYSTLNPPPGNIPLFGTANPNGVITGTLGQSYYDTSNVVEYICTTAGNNHWLRLSLPIGTIIDLAAGSAIPAGWIICNGVTQSGITPPNLIGMFRQGCNLTGVTGNGNSNGYDTGGTATPGTAIGAITNNLTHGHSFSGNLGSQTSVTVNAGVDAPCGQVDTGSVSGSTGNALGNISTQPAALTSIPIYKL